VAETDITQLSEKESLADSCTDDAVYRSDTCKNLAPFLILRLGKKFL
jgi:hypothetical protein